MNQKHQQKAFPTWVTAVFGIILTFALAFVGWLAYHGDTEFKYLTLAAGVGIVALLWFGDLKQLGNLPSLLLLGHAVFTMLTIFRALSGKFFLGRYAVTFTALLFFLYAVLRGRGDPKFARRAMSAIAGISTGYAVLGVEAVSTGYFKMFADSLLGEGTIQITIGGGRLYGVFGNCNIEASFYAIGIIFSIALICGTKNRWQRALWMLTLVCNAYALLLGISIIAIVCFGIACIVYLIAAGKTRGAVLLRMVIGAVFAAAGVLCELSSLGKRFAVGGMEQSYLWAVMLAFAIAAALMELAFGEKLSAALMTHEKVAFGAMIGVLALIAVYLAVGMSVTEPCTFSDSLRSIRRGVVVKPGEQTIQIDADIGVSVTIYSVSPEQVMTETSTLLFQGTADEAQSAIIEVPSDSSVCIVTLSGDSGATIRSAVIGGKRVKLHYSILPEFIARRLVTPGGSSSLLQRLTYVKDSMKLFRLSPLAGLGDGAFETAVQSVQDYEYESKHSHNQYVESLVEGGVIGFTLFTGAVIMMGVSLWKARKKECVGDMAWLYPVLCAEFTMSTLQMLWDVSMFVTAFCCMIYTLYGIIVSTCAEPLILHKTDKDSGEKTVITLQTDGVFRAACSILPLLFVVSVGLNIHAQKLIRQEVETLDEFMDNLQSAVKMDLYEKNDSKLSYVRAQMEYDEEDTYRAQADEYADELSTVRSNAMPYILTVYYLNTQQYEKAIDEAKRGAEWSASDSDMWNNCADALRQMFIDSGTSSPLLQEGGGSLLWGLEEYREMLLDRDARSLKPIVLTEGSKAFFDSVEILFDYRDDKDTLYALLSSVTEG